MIDLLEKAIVKIKDLPEHRQELAAEILMDFVSEDAEIYRLNPEERAGIEAGIAELNCGGGLDETEMLKFWRQAGVL